MTAHIAATLAALAALASCSGGGPAPAADPGAVADAAEVEAPWECSALPAALASARLAADPATGLLRDALARDVVMRGVNAGGRSKFSPFMPFHVDPEADLATVRTAADAHFARMRPWGLDAVRLTFSWEALEPSKGQIDERYLDRYEAVVDAAWAAGVRVIVDMHQDIYASPLCGDGFPPWTLTDPGPPRHD